MTIYMVTRYVQVGFDTCRQNVGAFSTSGAAWEWIVAQPDNEQDGTGPSVNYDVLPYEVDALTVSLDQPKQGNAQ